MIECDKPCLGTAVKLIRKLSSGFAFSHPILYIAVNGRRRAYRIMNPGSNEEKIINRNVYINRNGIYLFKIKSGCVIKLPIAQTISDTEGCRQILMVQDWERHIRPRLPKHRRMIFDV